MYGLGCLQIVNLENNILNIDDCWNLFAESESNFVHKYVVYHYFRSKGYVVKPGIKFGGDYCKFFSFPIEDFVLALSKYNLSSNLWLSNNLLEIESKLEPDVSIKKKSVN